jgi:hypothetical protein
MRAKITDNFGNVPEVQAEPIDVMPEMAPIENEPQQGVYELLPGMTAEEMKAVFFDKAALVEPNYKVYQLNSKNHRYYYRYNEQGEPEFFPSVTTILSQTMPQSPFLVQWIAQKGLEESERYKMERAAYGTFMHAQFETLLIERQYDLDLLKSRLKEYIEQQNLPADFIYYADDLKRDVLAFAQFVIDYDVKPLAVEISMVHPEKNYAGMVDLVCSMLTKPGATDRINAIVDFKSGRKGFYEEMEIQLHLYRDMWNYNFPEHQVERLFNFAPKDWRKKPSYHLKEQTESNNAKKIPAILELAAIEDEKRENTFTSTFGNIDLASGQLENNVVSLTLAELIKTKMKKQ